MNLAQQNANAECMLTSFLLLQQKKNEKRDTFICNIMQLSENRYHSSCDHVFISQMLLLYHVIKISRVTVLI